MAATLKTALGRQRRLLHQIIKSVREERHLTKDQVAAAMGVSKRTYHDFEKGAREYDFNKVRLFAKATRSDASAIHLGVQYNWPELPLLLMDNKMATAFYILARDLHGEYGDRLARVPAGLLIAGFRHISEDIKKFFERRAADSEDYMARAIQQSYEDPAGGGDGDSQP
jgi:transcriptional regulator with XRE-family HTH domain